MLNTNNHVLESANNGTEDELIDSNEHYNDEKSSENLHEAASIEGRDYLVSKEDDDSYEEEDDSYEDDDDSYEEIDERI